MPTVLQFRRGTTSQNNSFTGAAGELSVDTDLDVVRVHDGATAGGFALVGATSTQTLTNKTLTAPVLSGNTTGTANISITGAITATTLSGNGAGLTNLNASNVTSGTLGVSYLSGSYTGITGTGALNEGSITSGFGAINIGTDSITCGSLLNANANGVGNIGSSSTYFNTVFAKATSAQYADLAEYYIADNEYPVGTVLQFGGIQEVTQSNQTHTPSIAGTVSDKPAYIMNSGLDHDTRVAVALIGRVPCRVVGAISKGDRLAASHIPGVATRLDSDYYQPGCIIGKALENYNSDSEGMIEIVVGKL